VCDDDHVRGEADHNVVVTAEDKRREDLSIPPCTKSVFLAYVDDVLFEEEGITIHHEGLVEEGVFEVYSVMLHDGVSEQVEAHDLSIVPLGRRGHNNFGVGDVHVPLLSLLSHATKETFLFCDSCEVERTCQNELVFVVIVYLKAVLLM